MSASRRTVARGLNLRPLAAAAVLAFSLPMHVVAYEGHVSTGLDALKRSPRPTAPITWIVKNCTNGDTDSLRDIIQNPAKAQSGDIVDLTQLPTLCGSLASTITLASVITINQDDLLLQGPDASAGTVAVSGAASSMIFDHLGIGTLTISDLTVEDGYYHRSANAYGGCIASNGSVSLPGSTITRCVVKSDTGFAAGGAVAAAAAISLSNSVISGNQSIAPVQAARGGGLFSSGSIYAKYSSISHNIAQMGASGSIGGGIEATSTLWMATSTVDNNEAGENSALYCGAVYMEDSTVSENVAHAFATISAETAFHASNSTIAFNHAAATLNPSTIRVSGANSSLELVSSIVAQNTIGQQNTPADLYFLPGQASGTDNLVIASGGAAPPMGFITVTADPKLGPLQRSGGPTFTHQPLAGSPAISAGNDSASLLYDQRGLGYARMEAGNTVDIGAVQFNRIFVAGFDP